MILIPFALLWVFVIIVWVVVWQNTPKPWRRYNESSAVYQPPVAPALPVVQRHVERTVKVVSRPAPVVSQPAQAGTSVPTYQPSDVRLAITQVSQARRPVRHTEQVGNVRITDRRAFDPELGL